MTTTLSFRVDDALARRLETEARLVGATRSELLQQAVTELLYRRACERDAEIYELMPLTEEELTVSNDSGWINDAPGTDWEAIFGQ